MTKSERRNLRREKRKLRRERKREKRRREKRRKRKMKQQTNNKNRQKRSPGYIQKNYIDSCDWPQCNRSCPKLKDPETGNFFDHANSIDVI